MKGIYVSNGKVMLEREITVEGYIQMYHNKEVSALDAIYVLYQCRCNCGSANLGV